MAKLKINYIWAKTSTQSLASSKTSAGGGLVERSKGRPLSPHLQVYKWQRSMFYSILHRTASVGIGIIAILLLITMVIVDLENHLSYLILSFLFSFVGDVFLIASVACVSYYVFATLKYMFWDFAVLLEIPQSTYIGDITVFLSILSTVWITLCYIL